MFCSPPGRALAQLGAGRVKILRLAFQVTTASQPKKHPFRLYFRSARNWSTSFPTYHTASRVVRLGRAIQFSHVPLFSVPLGPNRKPRKANRLVSTKML